MKFLDTASRHLVPFVDRPPCDYAILSCAAAPSSQQSAPPRGLSPPSSYDYSHHPGRYIERVCQYARSRSIKYVWARNLCVDKTSLADAAEAVLASFRLIWDATFCIVHLLDLDAASSGNDKFHLEAELASCRWFTRAWALQELVAASNVHLLDCEWNIRVTKSRTAPTPALEMLARVSGVDIAVLSNRDELFNVSLGRRLSWAARRRSQRPEDAAYAIAGVCGVAGQLAPLYGEGGRAAFVRLQQTILRQTTDLSLLAWKSQGAQRPPSSPLSGILADSAGDFAHFASDPAWAVPFISDCEIAFTNRGLRLRAPAFICPGRPEMGRRVMLPLNTRWRQRCHAAVCVAISLAEAEPGLFVRADRAELVQLPSREFVGQFTLARICVPHILGDEEARRLHTAVQTCVSHRTAGPTEHAHPPPQHPGNKHLARRLSTLAVRPSKRPINGSLGRADKDDVATMQSTREPVSPLPHRPYKRARDSDADWESTGSHTSEADSDNPDWLLLGPRRGNKPSETPGLLACPFYLTDPVRFNSCLRAVALTDAAAVRHHLIEAHRVPPHCPVCFAVFEHTTERDRHIVTRSCTLRESAPSGLLEGVSGDQAVALARLGDSEEEEGSIADEASWSDRRVGRASSGRGLINHAHDMKLAWCRIWHVLFPAAPVPTSIYLSLPADGKV